MDLICSNETCQRTLLNINVFKGWDERKMKAALAMVNGDKSRLQSDQESATERNTTCPDCGSKMSSTSAVSKIANKMAKNLRDQAVKEDLHRELGEMDKFGEENLDDEQRKRVKEIEDELDEIEKSEK